MSKTIMILGAGLMQYPAYAAARRNGWVSIGVDGNPDAPCKNKADYFLPVDLKDRIGLADAAKDYQNTIGLDGVFTCGTDFSSTVAWIAGELNLPGIPYQTALDCTDKYRMRLKLQSGGILCPAFREVDSDTDLAQLLAEMSFPLVVKPVDNMGGRGVITAEDEISLEKSVQEAIRFSRTERAIVEEYMDGPEFSIDSLVYQGKLTITGFADRHIFFPPCFIEMGHTLPTALENSQQKDILDIFSKAVKVLGIDNGAAKGDIKLTSRGIMIGEIAARLSGGYMSGWTYPYASGIPLVEKGMMIALGMDPGSLEEVCRKTSSERAFISIPGVIENIRFIEEAHNVRGIKDIFLRVEEGDEITFPVNNVGKCGNVISLAETREEALRASEKAVSTIRIILKRNNPLTRDFLEQPLDTKFPPSAYNVSIRESDDLNKLDGFLPDFQMKYAVHPLPVIDSPELLAMKDWHGISLGDALKEIEIAGGIQISEKVEWTLFARHFWHTLLRGGVQGALWFCAENEE